jgi:hypothetical protein
MDVTDVDSLARIPTLGYQFIVIRALGAILD